MSKKKIIWKSEDEGTIEEILADGGKRTKACFSKSYGIKLFLCSLTNNLVQDPILLNKCSKKLEKSDEKHFTLPRHGTINWLTSVQPKISFVKISQMYENATPFIIQSIQNAFEKIKKIEEKEMSDLEFLLYIGGIKKRNWKSGCAICLSEKMMGTTCGCGHTEIIMFRPCGHSICINPCFETWVKHIGVELETRTLTFGDQQFSIPSQRNVDIDLSHNDKAVCPLCRTSIRNTFRVEDVRSNSKLYNFDIEGFIGSL